MTNLKRLLDDAAGIASRIVRDVAARDQDSLEADGERVGQYAFDLDVDGPVVEHLLAAGCGVLSEEAGELHLDREFVVVVDPVDGSTNAALGLPWYATSFCVVDEAGPLRALVVDHAAGTRFEAERGGGAFRDGVRLSRPVERPMERAIVGVNGRPPANAEWAQFRCFGAAALDLCAVATGRLGGYVDFDAEAHGVWDYLGAALVCAEVGVPVVDAFDRPLAVLDHAARRTPVAGNRRALTESLAILRRSMS